MSRKLSKGKRAHLLACLEHLRALRPRGWLATIFHELATDPKFRAAMVAEYGRLQQNPPRDLVSKNNALAWRLRQ